MRLLLVEDEDELAALVRRALERAGFAVDLARDIAGAREHLDLAQYDALVLDLGLPDGNGIDIVRLLRARGSGLPLLLLTARDSPDERVGGLDAGADDYLVKPFHMPELVARLRALLRRPNAALGVTLGLGNLAFDTVARQVRVADASVSLSVREMATLELLLRRQGMVVAREALEQGLYGFDAQLGSNAIEVLVHRVRRKLQDASATLSIHTVRGVGYLLAEIE